MSQPLKWSDVVASHQETLRIDEALIREQGELLEYFNKQKQTRQMPTKMNKRQRNAVRKSEAAARAQAHTESEARIRARAIVEAQEAEARAQAQAQAQAYAQARAEAVRAAEAQIRANTMAAAELKARADARAAAMAKIQEASRAAATIKEIDRLALVRARAAADAKMQAERDMKYYRKQIMEEVKFINSILNMAGVLQDF